MTWATAITLLVVVAALTMLCWLVWKATSASQRAGVAESQRDAERRHSEWLASRPQPPAEDSSDYSSWV